MNDEPGVMAITFWCAEERTDVGKREQGSNDDTAQGMPHKADIGIVRQLERVVEFAMKTLCQRLQASVGVVL